MDRSVIYASALRKVLLCERPNRAEARELRRRRLADGSCPAARLDDRRRRVGIQLRDPRSPVQL